MSMEESISLEETNRIRISLGLKPLTDDKAPTSGGDQEAEENYRKQREREKKERESKRIADGIAKVKNKRELHSSLKGATLGDQDGDNDSTLKWIKRNKQKQKELAQKKLDELAKMDESFLEDYSEKDLAGLKVSHDLDALKEGEDQILTLKDSRILDNEEDELQNVQLADHERTKKNNELKIKKRDYTGFDDDEFGGGIEGAKKKILAKYDDELDGVNETGFRLGAGAAPRPIVNRREQPSSATVVNKSLLSIDYIKNVEISDYLQEGDVGFKKPKTKRKKASRRAPIDLELANPAEEDEKQAAMAIDEKPDTRAMRDLDMNFVDDDDLQAALARERRAKMRHKRVLKPEEIAHRVMQERNTENQLANAERTNGLADKEEEEMDTQLVFDDTSEFVRSISYNPASALESKISQPIIKEEAQEADLDRSNSEELEAGEVDPKEEEEKEEAMLHAIQIEAESVPANIKQEEEPDMGTSSEQIFGSGLGSTLAILRQQGVLKAPTAEQSQREGVQKDRDRWLADHRSREIKSENDRLNSRAFGKDQGSREYENRIREQQEQRMLVESFKDYKPDVNIVYYDEFGRSLTPKEAWKALSHTFHGKGSGKAKTEKRLKRIAEEKKKEAMASGDTPLSMNKNFQIRQEKAGQAHMVLSVGNRGAAPQVADFLATPQLSKGKADKKGKKKEAQDSNGAEGTRSAGKATPEATSSAVISAPPTAASPLPTGMMKPSFARISSTAEATSGFSTPSASIPDRTKLTIGLKRKAGEQTTGPASKRR